MFCVSIYVSVTRVGREEVVSGGASGGLVRIWLGFRFGFGFDCAYVRRIK